MDFSNWRELVWYCAKKCPLSRQNWRAMRLSLVLILASALQVQAYNSWAQDNVSLSFKNAPIQEVFMAIHKQTGYNFAYNESVISKAKPVSISVINVSLKQALDICFQNQPITYEVEDKIIILRKKLQPLEKNSVDKIPDANIDVKGRVLNENGEPIEGVTVKVKGTGISIITTNNGEFELNNIDRDAILVFTHVAMETLELKVGGRSQLDIRLKTKISALGGVTVTLNTGYEKISKERATGSFDVVDNQLLNRRFSSNILDRIENLTPGVFFDERNNAPDEIQVRGRSTINSVSSPLIVLDNFPYNGSLENINPNDIESITILKDAAAASIWGAKSGNGVIVITTKKGKSTKPQVSFVSNVKIDRRPDLFNIPRISSTEYIELEKILYSHGYYTGAINTPNALVTPVVQLLDAKAKGNLPPEDADALIESYKSYDIRNDINKYLYRTAISQQYFVNVSGSTPTLSYYTSLGYDNNLRPTKGDGQDRLTLNSRNTFRIAKNLSLETGLSYIQNKTTSSNNPGIYLSNGGGKNLYPYARLINDNGFPVPLLKDLPPSLKQSAVETGLLNWDYSPIEDLNYVHNDATTKDFLLNVGLNYSLFKGLELDLRYSSENQNRISEVFYDANSYYARNLINRYTQVVSPGELVQPIPLGGIKSTSNTETKYYAGRAQISYEGKFREIHELTTLAGMEISHLRVTSTFFAPFYGYNTKSNTINPSIDYTTEFPLYGDLNRTAKIPGSQAFVGQTTRYLSYYINAAYTFKNRYTISGSAREDASNLFGVKTNQKGVPLWSSGIVWLLSNEKFYKIRWIPQLKLRATYGYQGNSSPGISAFLTASSVVSPITGAQGAIIINPPNEKLRWEKVGTFNVGLDFSIIQNILSGSIEMYKKKATDLIARTPIDPTLGITYYQGNTASMQGNGFDIQLESQISKRNLKWTVNVLFSKQINKVTDYYLVASSVGRNYVYNAFNPIPGRPLYSFYSYPWAGLDANGNPMGIWQGQKSTNYGSIVSSTLLDSMHFSGSFAPIYLGAFRNTIQCGRLSLSFLISYKGGHHFRKSSIMYDELFSTWSGHSDYSLRWQKSGDENTTNVPAIPPYPFDNLSNRDFFYKYSEVLIRKADHIRFEDISLSYEMDRNLIKSLPFQSARLYMYINHLGLLWTANKEKIDPVYLDLPTPGVSASIGININF